MANPTTRQPATRRPHLWRNALLLTSLTAVPVAAMAMAQVDAEAVPEMQRFMEVLEAVQDNYVEPVSRDKLIEGAIKGMLESLDPHSAYMNKRDFNSLRTQIDGEYGGLGLSVTMEDGVVKVIAPQADTPADRAGLKSGDYITHIDGALLYGMALDEAVEKLRGKPGSTVKLTVVRPGRDKPIDATIVREVIDLKPVKWEMKGNIAVIRLSTFSGDAFVDMRSAIVSAERALGRKPAGYILDLRSNPGGRLDQAVGISDIFMTGGEIVSERGRRPADVRRFSAETMQGGDMTNGAPIIVLIDAGSASASEIVAGALQDSHRAVVMGERSFGKGSVQSVVEFDDGAALRLTVARYYTPSGHSVQEGGIEPDIRVPQLSDPDYKTRPQIRESALRRHLANEAGVEDNKLEDDGMPDPRFTQTADQLKKQGIEDFQMHYALQTMQRIMQGQPVQVPVAATPKPKG